MRDTVIRSIEARKLIAILRGIPADRLIPTAEALYRGGIRLLEVTYSADGSVPDADTANAISTLVRHFQGRMHIGAGTVLTPAQVRLTGTAGGTFIISPDTNPEVIAETRHLGLVSIPGALTPTEIMTAHRAGADFVKLFPISALGAAYVKAIRAPLSHVRLLAVGGVDESNMADYLNAGVCGFGLGSNLADKKLALAGDFDALTARAEKYIGVIAHG
jgi:2-dehydro-3-deoxyphosphogluconate aldolase/(4S)-4-hydroxy-2-oxoglutarate aldolase